MFVALELSKACFLLWTMQVHIDTFSLEVHKHDREGFPRFVGFRERIVDSQSSCRGDGKFVSVHKFDLLCESSQRGVFGAGCSLVARVGVIFKEDGYRAREYL